MKKCSNCGHMNNSRAKFCEECGKPLTKSNEKKADVAKVENKAKNFAHSLMTESMSEQEKQKYERELRRGARFDEIDMLEIGEEAPKVDKTVLRPQDLPDSTVETQESADGENKNKKADAKKSKIFGWFRKEKPKDPVSFEPKKSQPRNAHPEVEIPNLMDKVEINEEKVVSKFAPPEIDSTENTPTLADIAKSERDEEEQARKEKAAKDAAAVSSKQDLTDDLSEPSDRKTKKKTKDVALDTGKVEIEEVSEAVESEQATENSSIEMEEEASKEPKVTTKEVVIVNDRSQPTEGSQESFGLPKTLPVHSKHEQKEEQKKSDAKAATETSGKELAKTKNAKDAAQTKKIPPKKQADVTTQETENEIGKESKADTEVVDASVDEKAVNDAKKEKSQEAVVPQTSVKETTDKKDQPTNETDEVQESVEEKSKTDRDSSSKEETTQLQENPESSKAVEVPEVSKEPQKDTQFVRPMVIEDKTVEVERAPEVPEKSKKKIWFWVVGILILLGLIGGVFVYGQTYYSKEEQINRFIKSLDSKNEAEIIGQLEVENKTVALNKETIQPFLKLLKEDKKYTKNLRGYLVSAKNNQPSDSQDIYLKKSGKKFFFFDEYQFILRPLDFTVHTNKKDATIWLEGKQVAKSGSEKYSATLGPVLPGQYLLVAKAQDGEKTLENEYPKPLTRTNGQDLDKINLDIVALNFTVKSNAKEADVFVDDKQVGVLKNGELAVGPVSWREGSKVQLRKTLGSDVVKTESVELTEKQGETYTLDFPEMLTLDNTQQVVKDLFIDIQKAINEDKYDYKKSLAAKFVDGEKNSGYKNLAQYIETSRDNKQLSSSEFSTKMVQLTPKSAETAQGVFEVTIVKNYTDETAKDPEKMVQKYSTLFQGTEKAGKYLVQIKTLGTPETVVDKVAVTPAQTTEPAVVSDPEIIESFRQEDQQQAANSTDDTQAQTQANSNSGNSSSSSSEGSSTDRNEGINYGSGFNSVNTTQFLEKVYDVFQNAAKNDNYNFEDAFATYFVGGKNNPDYQDFVDYIDLCRRRADYAYVVFTVKVGSVTMGADGQIKVVYDITYETHYQPASGKATRVETFRYNADMANENGVLKIKSLGKATKIYDNNANT